MGNVTVTRRDPLPGETVFGGRGVLIPFRLPGEPPKQTPSSSPESACAVTPAQGDAAAGGPQSTEAEAQHHSEQTSPAASGDPP